MGVFRIGSLRHSVQPRSHVDVNCVAKVCMSVFSTIMAPSNENKSWPNDKINWPKDKINWPKDKINRHKDKINGPKDKISHES